MFRQAVWIGSALAVALAVCAPTAEAQGQAALHSSTQKYAEKNMTGGKGRAGGASLAARLLYAKDGTTLLEATTGEFGSATPPPGTIWKMQISALDANGVTMYTLTYNNLNNGGYFSQVFTDLLPGQPFQIQAHVRTSTKRNDVVAVTASVQKRPDIAVTRIDAPPRIPVGKAIKINAVVSELNNNIGGRTDCVLDINGVEADRANAIWVDSGDAVTCAFSPTFAATGYANVRVRTVNVDPGDWDPGNNAADVDVLVSTLTPDWDVAWADALVYDKNHTFTQQQGRYVNSTFTAGFDWYAEGATDTDGDVWHYTAGAAGVPGQASNVVLNVTDGVNAWSVQRAVASCDDFAMDKVNGRTFYVAVSACGVLYVQTGGYSGTVTYTSTLVTHAFNVTSITNVVNVAYTAPAQYIYNNEVETKDVNGTNIFDGNNWTIDVQVTAGDFVFSKPLSFSLSPIADSGTVPLACHYNVPTTNPSGLASYCEAGTWEKAARYGATVFPQ